MKSLLYLKFIVIYAIFGFLGIFVIATLTLSLTLSNLKNDTASSLYQEANATATTYLPKYFSKSITLNDTRVQLEGMSSFLKSTIWFVDKDGTMITGSGLSNYRTLPSAIHDFNPTESGSAQYQEGTYHDYFDEDVLTVIAPVAYDFTTKGYLLIHKPLVDIQKTRDSIMFPVSVSFVIIYVLSFMILLAFQFFVYRPLRQITEAATQYASGNLNYEIPVKTEDEMGYLSASLNYMSSQLRDMDDYQKKFVANVSHDFRSPLTSIKGYVEAISDGTIPPELHEKYLKIVLFETERLTDLTQDLLTLNEFDTKDLLLNKQTFDIHEIVKNTAASFEGTCTQKKISINLLLATKHLLVVADQRKINQVLYNLIDNAIKFSEPDSEITIETTERGDKIYLSVKDHGSGISRDALNKIWERFYKIDSSRGKDKKGTGLGLAIVKEIMQAHNENINVISTEDVGTEFIFSLPKGKHSDLV